jgi:hypothetical protein
LDRARWDADQARDRLRDYVLEELSGPDAVLIADETGFLKKGEYSVEVKRSTPARRDALRTARLACFSDMPVTKARRWLTVSCIFLKNGLPIATVAAQQQFQKRSSLPPSRS